MKKITALALAILAPIISMAASSYGKGKHYEEQVTGSVSVGAGTELHITGVEAPLAEGARIDLAAADSWLVFEGVKASAVKANWLNSVTVAGKPAKHPDNVRLALWGSGCVVIPNGHASDRKALTLYSQPDCKGQKKEFGINTYYRGLGTLDNNVQSFKLKRGYMATLANNPDGTGHSRVWIAADSDIVVNVMPEGFVTYRGEGGTFNPANTESFVSFVRVMRWEWTGKKGWGGGSPSELVLSNIDSYYSWSANKIYDAEDKAAVGFYEIDREFSPIKQQYWWPGWGEIDSLQNVTHLCGYNEPNQKDQADQPVDVAIEQWPYMFTSGLRLGSPAPTGVYTNWSDDFWAAIKRYNYRCDINVTHIYEYISGEKWKERIAHMVEESGGRPCWVTEYNNGAGWTGEKWPDQKGPRVDVHGNLIDKDGKPTTTEVIVARPATAANMERQRQWMEKFLPSIDDIDKLERAHIFNWVEDARSVIINGELTPAGEIFAKHVSEPGYKASGAYDHVWKIAPPALFPSFDGNYENLTLKFYDHNGETGQMYVFSLLLESGWTVVDTLKLGVDYQPGERVSHNIAFPEDAVAAQVKAYAVSYKGEKSLEYVYNVESEPLGRPQIKAHGYGKTIKVEWDEVDNAVEYIVKVGLTKDNLIGAAKTTGTEYTYYTEPETVYYFQVDAVGRFGSKSSSSVLRVYSGMVGIGSPEADELTISSAPGAILIESPVQCELSIYMPDGRLCRTVCVEAGSNVVNGLQPGAYIVNRQKVFVY